MNFWTTTSNLEVFIAATLISLAGYLDRLTEQNLSTQSFRFAKASARNIISGIRSWAYFCTYFDLKILPASVQHIIWFLELNSLTSGYAHIKHLLRSVHFLHEASDTPFPTNSFDVDTTLQGLKRRLLSKPKQALPITPVELRQMYQQLDTRKVHDLAHWCSHLTAFYGMFRKSNTVPPSADYDEDRVLKRKHFLITDDNVLIFVDFSKTIQFGNRDYVIPVPKNDDPALDLHRHLSDLFRRVEASQESPAFTFGKASFVTYTTFTSMLRKWLDQAGLKPLDYTGHSFRRGSATFLHRCGGTVLQIRASGDWATDVFTRYLHLSIEEREDAQLLIAKAISTTWGITAALQ